MSQQLAHFLRTTATPLAADKWYMLAEYGLEASAVALLSQRWRRGGGKRRELLGEQLKRLGMAISTARILYVCTHGNRARASSRQVDPLTNCITIIGIDCWTRSP